MAALYCEECGMWTNGPTQWEEHRIGKKHKKNTRRQGRRKTVEELYWVVEEMEIVIPKGTALIIEQTAMFKDAVEVFMLSLYRRCALRCRL